MLIHVLKKLIALPYSYILRQNYSPLVLNILREKNTSLKYTVIVIKKSSTTIYSYMFMQNYYLPVLYVLREIKSIQAASDHTENKISGIYF